jgi:dipeptidyl aminopeptidase/acylaminoacyl peptidase
MNKRALAILGAIFLLIVGALGFLIYQRSQKEDVTDITPVPVVQNPDEPSEPTTPDEPTPEVPSSRATRLSDDQVIAPILVFQGNGITYFDQNGHLYKTDLKTSGTNILLSNKTEFSLPLKSNISRVLWPQIGQSFIAEFNSGGKKSWSFYDSNRGQYVDLPAQIVSLDWLPNGDKIMFVWVDINSKATINTANADTSGYQQISELYEPDNEIKVSPDGKSVLFYRTQNPSVTENNINYMSPDGKVFKTIVKGGYNFGVRWAPDNRRFLFSKRDTGTQKFQLWMGDVVSGEIRSLGITTTEQKAVWSKDSRTIIVAVPTTGTAGAGLTQDTIYRFNVNTLEKQEFNPGIAIDAQDLFLNSTEDVLFFRNAQDQALYYMHIQ